MELSRFDVKPTMLETLFYCVIVSTEGNEDEEGDREEESEYNEELPTDNASKTDAAALLVYSTSCFCQMLMADLD
jgi:hypothetical protein